MPIPPLTELRSRFHQAFDEWAAGRSWAWRLPLLAVIAWLGWRTLVDGEACFPFGGINLGIHEAGHLLTRPFGAVVCAASGSLFQCAAPVAAAAVLLRIPDFLGLPFCLVWFGSNLAGVGRYVADARAMELQLVTVGGGDVQHDWNFLLDTFGMLGWDGFLGGLLRLGSVACAIAGIALAAWMLWRMRALAGR